MEKTIKMSLSDAKLLYNNSATMNHWLLQNFTKEELEELEEEMGINWNNSFKPGYVIDSCPAKLDVIIKKCSNPVAQDHFKNQYATEKQAKSALAFAQLSHIVSKYNDEFKSKNINTYGVCVNNIHKLEVMTICDYMCHLVFRSHADATISMRENNELWKQYWMIDETN